MFPVQFDELVGDIIESDLVLGPGRETMPLSFLQTVEEFRSLFLQSRMPLCREQNFHQNFILTDVATLGIGLFSEH